MASLLGTFEQAVLLAIVRLKEHAYGRSILHQVQSSLGRSVSAGSVYTTLDRLESNGFASSRVEEGTPIRGGRARRYYTVSADGVRALDAARRTISAMWKGIRLPLEVT